MKSVTRPRKERIMEERAKDAKNRRRKVLGYALAGTVATSVILSIHSEKALAYSSTYVVQKGDTLYSLAQKYGVSIEQIQGANGISSELIKVGQILEVPTLVKTHIKKEKLSNTKKETNRVYTVVPGDSLYLLAQKYGVSMEQIQKVNGLPSDMIKVDQILEIPLTEVHKAQTKAEVHKVRKQATLDRYEKITYATYTVAPGESLWSIATQFNTSIDEIKAYNHLSNNAVLIGQKLIIKQRNFIKADATVGGAVDNFSVEFMINGEPIVLQVAYGTASNFEGISGKKVELVFSNMNRPTLVSYVLAD
jgi:LysM repeat protein